MNTEKAIEILKKINVKSVSGYGNAYVSNNNNIDDIIALLKTNQELVTKFSSEGDEYQKKLDQIDELALLIENAIKRIRGKI